MSCHTF